MAPVMGRGGVQRWLVWAIAASVLFSATRTAFGAALTAVTPMTIDIAGDETSED
jgi:hypothetical protein